MNNMAGAMASLGNAPFAANKTLRERTLSLEPRIYYPLNEASGISAVDLIGAANGIYTPNSAGAWTGGTLNNVAFNSAQNAPAFNGTSGYVALSQAAMPFTSAPSFSVSMWLRKGITTGIRALFSQAANTGTSLIQIATTNNSTKVNFQLRNTANANLFSVASLGDIADNNWHHVVLSVNATGYSIFIDGLLDRSANHSAVAQTFDFNRTAIAASLATSATLFAPASIAEVALFTRDLTLAEASAITGDKDR